MTLIDSRDDEARLITDRQVV